ncbi:MAG TPA: hypothetical protein VJU84_08795 [Pyrinomonadaceae bacterium]|nr:hypothetical protein [Pyrinomonadaceae bacterium]
MGGRRKQQSTPGAVALASLKFIVKKLRPLADEVAALEEQLEPKQDGVAQLRKRARVLAKEAWAQMVERAANEWKSAHGDEELTLEWADEQFSKLAPEIVEFCADSDGYRSTKDEGFDSVGFFDDVLDAIQGDDE